MAGVKPPPYDVNYNKSLLRLKLICEITTPANINPQPTYPSSAIRSILNNTPPMALNIDSVEKTIAATVGSERF